ncbi:hypothetical protein, partial [Vibrio vulnificus]|uniref:hypothetical protein n=1 Tax=Vibrio vulnificus TaxID=672 RepID=UPI004059B389
GRVFQSDGKEVKLTLTGYFWRYGIRKAIQVSIFRMNPNSTSLPNEATQLTFNKHPVFPTKAQNNAELPRQLPSQNAN